MLPAGATVAGRDSHPLEDSAFARRTEKVGLNRQTIRRTIGDVRSWSIDAARKEADELRVTLNRGQDPREIERARLAAEADKLAAAVAQVQADKLTALTVGEVWAVYLAERRPHWGELHYRDHIDHQGRGLALRPPRWWQAIDQAGATGRIDAVSAQRPNRRKGRAMSRQGRQHPRIVCPSCVATADRVSDVVQRATRVCRVTACQEPGQDQEGPRVLGQAGTKSDVLQREQLAAWFAAVQQLQNPVTAACLQVMLLTGARPGEVLALRWVDINTKCKGITIRDKVEGTREIPATPYMLHLLAALPRGNGWVFSSPTSESGCLTEPNNLHTRACRVAGLEGLTLHGLRRSFSSLTEWLEMPAGVVAQIMGHKPGATAEKHYQVRPLELLRVHHQKIEAWILEQAGIVFHAKALSGALRVVTA